MSDGKEAARVLAAPRGAAGDRAALETVARVAMAVADLCHWRDRLRALGCVDALSPPPFCGVGRRSIFQPRVDR